MRVFFFKGRASRMEIDFSDRPTPVLISSRASREAHCSARDTAGVRGSDIAIEPREFEATLDAMRL